MIPKSEETESAVLGSMILENETIPQAISLLTENCFSNQENRNIFKVIKQLFNDKKPIDQIIVYQELKKQNKNPDLKYISRLSDNIPFTPNIESYAIGLIYTYKLRFLIEISSKIIADAKETGADPDEILKTLNSTIKNYDVKETVHSKIKDVVFDTVSDFEEMQKRPDIKPGLQTGIYKFDEVTGGLRDDDFILVGARPSMGKTAFMLNIANGCSINNNKPNIVIYSLESGKKKLATRMIGQRALINTKAISNGTIKYKEDYDKFYASAGEISDFNITFIDEPNMKFEKIVSSVMYLDNQERIDLIFIDYVQLIGLDPKKQKHDAFEDVSKGLKNLARTLNCPIIALAQLNRSLETRPNKKPVMSDLKGSGSWEQDADIIMFIYRDVVYHPNTNEPDKAEIIIGKSREGETGTFNQKFIPEYTLFKDYE